MIKAYFFDWGKTLGDFKDVINFGDVLTKEQEDTLLVTKRFKDFQIENNKKRILHYAIANAQLVIYEDTKNTIKRLKDSGFKLALVSNTYCMTPDRMREFFGEVLSYFDVLTFSSEVGMKKPNHEIFFYTLNRLNSLHGTNILPQEIVMIGDKQESDIIPAKEIGIEARLIDRNKQNLCDII